MRTKTLLLTAAALVAGIGISQADPVYSANIVGYANIATLNPGSYYLLACPFQTGVSNGANEVFGTTLPDGSLILTWNVNSQSYTTTMFDSTQPLGAGLYWYDLAEANALPPPKLPTGQGFFLLPTAPVTNVFSGAVSVNVGSTVTIPLANAGSYYLLGSPIPYAGSITNGSSLAAGVNLNGLPDGSLVLSWSVSSQSYTTTMYDSTAPLGAGLFWYDLAEANALPVPTIGVGGGFFVLPTGSYNWIEKLPFSP
jgi:hypothetical protein